MKMDKREIILCLLFACLFITMIFIKAFAVDAADPVNVTTLPHHGKQAASEILADDTSYNSWLSELQAAGADVASNVWSTASDMARNLLAYGVGCVANVSEEVLQVAFPDLEHYLGDMYFDWDSLEWEFTTPDDVEDFIKTGLDPYVYTSSSLKGNWLPANQNSHFDNFIYSSSVNNSMCLTVANPADCYFTVVHTQNSDTFLVSCTSDSSWKWANIYYGNRSGQNMSYFDGNDFYRGSTWTVDGNTYYYLSFAWRYRTVGGSSLGNISPYSSVNDALTDLWGVDHSGSVLSGDVLYFDEPSFQPLGYYPSTGLDFTEIVNEGNTNNYDYSVVNNYNTYYPTTYNFDIPYWFKVPSTVPKIYDLPSDYDYGNIQFEYEADPSFLDGAGLVQDVFDILPDSLQSLIILFGAGTCAFIFLRR